MHCSGHDLSVSKLCILWLVLAARFDGITDTLLKRYLAIPRGDFQTKTQGEYGNFLFVGA